MDETRATLMPRYSSTQILTAIFCFSWIGIACAADLPGPPAYPPPQAPPVFSWTGFYIGANAGYGWSNGSGNMLTRGAPDTFSASGNAFVGGGQAGFNYQFGGGVVVGIEADFQGTWGSGTLTDGRGLIDATVKDPYFGTVRGRLGYAWDRVLLYGTGGGVYGDATANGKSAGTEFSNSASYWTWTAGAGAEWAFAGPWSAKIEYLYAGSPSSVPAIPFVSSIGSSAHSNLIRAGLNYHF